MISKTIPYTYTTLRYVHDITTREFVNVGVVLYAPSAKFIGARCITHSTRLGRMFPAFNAQYFASLLSHVQAQFDIANSSLQSEPIRAKIKTIDEFVGIVLPKDDSSLQWDSIGSGVTSDPKIELAKLFDRLVVKHEAPIVHQVESQAGRESLAVEKELAEAKAKLEQVVMSCHKLERNLGLVLTIVTQYLMQSEIASPKAASPRPSSQRLAVISGGIDYLDNRSPTAQNSTGIAMFVNQEYERGYGNP